MKINKWKLEMKNILKIISLWNVSVMFFVYEYLQNPACIILLSIFFNMFYRQNSNKANDGLSDKKTH